jgi:hypothetical protein
VRLREIRIASLREETSGKTVTVPAVHPSRSKQVIIATIFAGAFFAVAVVSLLVLMRVAMNREHRSYLSNQAPTPLARAMRTISGLHVQMPERDLQVLSGPPHRGLDQDDDEPTISGTTPRHLEGIR